MECSKRDWNSRAESRMCPFHVMSGICFPDGRVLAGV
jgi:hypothetical protein